MPTCDRDPRARPETHVVATDNSAVGNRNLDGLARLQNLLAEDVAFSKIACRRDEYPFLAELQPGFMGRNAVGGL